MTVNVCVTDGYMVMKTVDREEIVNSSIDELGLLKPKFWRGLGSWEAVVAVSEDVVGRISDKEFTGNTTVECTLDKSETKMPGCGGDDSACLLNPDEAGLGTRE